MIEFLIGLIIGLLLGPHIGTQLYDILGFLSNVDLMALLKLLNELIS